MKWVQPEFTVKFLLQVVGTGIGLFLATWAGYGNGPSPRSWGDPVPLNDAVAKIPRIGFAIVLVLVVSALIKGVKVRGDDES
jgi:hypothetical protein